MELDLEQLKKAARAADQGVWSIGQSLVETNGGYIECLRDGGEDSHDENMQFIGQASPAVVLELVARLERAQSALLPFAKAYNAWNGGDAREYFSDAVAPAQFRSAFTALAGAAQHAAYADQVAAALYQPDARSQDVARVPEGWKLVPVEPTVTMIQRGMGADSTAINALIAHNCYVAMLAAAPQVQQPSMRDERHLSERLIAAIEGECDGLAVTEEQASNILSYLQYGAPICAMSEAFRIVTNAIGLAEDHEPKGGNLRIVTLRIDQARQVRAALAQQPPQPGAVKVTKEDIEKCGGSLAFAYGNALVNEKFDPSYAAPAPAEPKGEQKKAPLSDGPYRLWSAITDSLNSQGIDWTDLGWLFQNDDELYAFAKSILAAHNGAKHD